MGTHPSSSSSLQSFYIAHVFAITIMLLIIRGFLIFSNTEEAFAFYGVFHRTPINQLIHFFGVPLIVGSGLTFFAHLTVPLPFFKDINIQLPCVRKHSLNYGTLLILVYVFFYIHMDLFGGLLYAPFGFALYAIANNVTIDDKLQAKKKIKEETSSGKLVEKVQWIGTCVIQWIIFITRRKWTSHRFSCIPYRGKVLKLAGFIHLLGWYVQIHPGHGIFEGAKPALLESLGGSLTTAPLFAYYEGIWFLGLNRDLKERVQTLVNELTIEYCEKGLEIRACADYNWILYWYCIMKKLREEVSFRKFMYDMLIMENTVSAYFKRIQQKWIE